MPTPCDNNCEAVADLHESSVNLIQYSNLFNSWLNGAANGYVNIGGVSTPTLRNLAYAIKELVGVHPDNKTIGINAQKEIYVIRKSGGGLKADTGGMYVDVAEIIQLGGGLAKDPETGAIYVDFNQMPTTKFEAMMKSLDIPIPLKNHMTFYVDKALGSDTLDEGRGKTRNKPFASISACLEYVCSTYNFKKYNMAVEVNDGVYEEFVTVPDYTATTGALTIQPRNMGATRKVVVRNPEGQVGTPFTITGTKQVTIKHLDIRNEITAASVTSRIYPAVLSVAKGASARLYGVSCELSYTGSTLGDGGAVTAQMLNIGGSLYFYPDSQLPMRLAHAAAIPAGSNILMINASGGELYLVRSRETFATHKVLCSGAVSVVAQAEVKGSILHTGSGTNVFSFEPESGKTITGKRYNCVTGGTINAGDADYFPGTTAGTVDSATYSWYK